MNEDRLQGSWAMLKGRIREQWGKLTDDEIEQAGGKWDHLAGLIQNKYGRAKDAVDKEVALFRQQQQDAARERDRADREEEREARDMAYDEVVRPM